MQDNDKAEFALLMTSIAELYSKKLSQTLLALYWSVLKNYSLKDIRKAVSQVVVNPDIGQFMPKPADIIRAIDGGNQNRAMRAWSKVIAAIKQVGAYDSVRFDDPIIHVVINEMGGWISICQMLEKDLPFKYSEFEKRYSSYLFSSLENYPKKLIGKIEQFNPDVFRDDDVKLIGHATVSTARKAITH